MQRLDKGYILQWVITTAYRADFFCERGDSGSIVFDLSGRIAGIIDGGSGNNHPSLDLAYLTPIDWIMEDIEAKFGPAAFL